MISDEEGNIMRDVNEKFVWNNCEEKNRKNQEKSIIICYETMETVQAVPEQLKKSHGITHAAYITQAKILVIRINFCDQYLWMNYLVFKSL